MLVGVFLQPWHWSHSVYPIRNRSSKQARRLVDCTICFLLMTIWKLISCLVYYTYFVSWLHPKPFCCIMRNRTSSSVANFVSKLLCELKYFTPLWNLMIRVCKSIYVFIRLPGWPFPLNYGLRSSVSWYMYSWFCFYSPPRDNLLYNIGTPLCQSNISQLGYYTWLFQEFDAVD